MLSYVLSPCPVELPRLPESIKTVPETSPMSPQALQMVARPSPKSPQTSQNVSKQPQDISQTSTGAFQEFPQGPETLKSDADSLHLRPTCTQRPWSAVQGQRSQVRSPEFMAGSAGPRRVCDLESQRRRKERADVR